MAFRMTEVNNSKAIKAHGYNDKTGTMVVKFINGSRYYFKGVSKKRYTDFEIAESKGRFFNQMMRDAYKFSRHYGKSRQVPATT